jgi:uncharacterized protein YnzC (UPF0291/DUF896 family)
VFVKNFSHYLGFITIEQFLALMLQMTLQQPQLITEGKLKQLGVGRKPLKKSAVLKAYRQIVRENIQTVPIIDENSDFLGVMEKDKIEQAAVNLLTKGE